MQRVRMKQTITGTRDGVEWPPVGDECDLPDGEADAMAQNNYAEIVGEPDTEAAAAKPARRGRRGRGKETSDAQATPDTGDGDAGGPDAASADPAADAAGEPDGD